MINGELARLAACQDGVVTAEQAAEAGLTTTDIRRMRRRAEWAALARGTYWVRPQYASRPGDTPPLRTRARAALLSCGPRAVAVGPTAAMLHGIEGSWGSATEPVHVATPAKGGRRPGIVLHRLYGQQVMHVRGWP